MIAIHATKLHKPRPRPSWIVRERLLTLLDRSLEEAHPLTLVSAPAGAGKTTLLAHWLAARNHCAAWLSLDPDDDEPVRFWTCVLHSLQSAVPGLGQWALEALSSQAPPPVLSLLPGLMNEIGGLAEPLILVLDDYHVLAARGIHESIASVVDHLPEPLHLVICTRADPLLPLARWRAGDALTEVRAAELRFTPEEALAFLNQRMDLQLEMEDAERLVKHTEGWAVGLQLAALSLQGQADPARAIQALGGSQHFVLEYLLEEVLARQPEPIQRFLLDTSILNRLCAPLCDAVVNIQHSQSLLEYLQRQNLFIVPLDEERYWYRYHHLFADLLRRRLVQSFGDGQVQILHSRAATWYEENHFSAEAIEHAFAAHETKRAGRLIEEIADSAWLSGEFYQVLRWIEALPEELMRSRPWLCVWYAWSRLQAGTMQGVEELIDCAERAARPHLDPSPAPGLARDEALMEQVAALRVTVAGLRQETDKTIELASRALQRSAASSQAASLMARSNVLNVLGFAYYVSGELTQAEQAYREARRVAQESGFVLRELLVVHKLAHILQVTGRLFEPYQLYRETLVYLQEQGKEAFFAAGYLYCGLSHLLYEWNRFDEAQQMIVESLRLNELAQVPHLTIDTCQAQARLFLAQRDVAGAQAALAKAAHLIQKHYCWPEVVSANECYQVRLWLARDDMESVARWAAEWSKLADAAPDFRHEQDLLTLARAWLALGRAEKAAELLARMQQSAARGGRWRRSAEILALLAKAWQALGQGRRAGEALEQSLTLAAPMGCVRVFLDQGPELMDLVAAASRRPGLAPRTQKFVRCIVASSPEHRPEGSPRSGPPAAHSLVEPLTPREQEVLALLAAGCSNQDIAGRLVITLASVKKHAGSIYGKLGVTSRTQAVVRAQQLGLLGDKTTIL